MSHSEFCEINLGALTFLLSLSFTAPSRKAKADPNVAQTALDRSAKIGMCKV